MGAAEGTGVAMALEGRCHWGVVNFLERTRVGSRAPAEMARLRMDVGREDAEVLGQENEEDGPGPP